MLDKQEILHKLNDLIPGVIINTNNELKILKESLQWFKSNHDRLSELFGIAEVSTSSKIDETFAVDLNQDNYKILGIDGSQIYPDKHQGINCFLLNIGIASFSYAQQSSVFLKSFPSIYFENDAECEITIDNINYLRTQLEFLKGFELSQIHKDNIRDPFVFLFDGPLYFWYLENKPENIKKRFLSSYVSILNLFYSKKIPIIGFLSAPKNKDIINLIKVGITQKIIDLGYECNTNFQFTSDMDFVSFFLKPYSRTALFKLTSNLSMHYPEHLRPCYCYINFGEEIARIEFPYWLTQDINFEKYLNILVDQCKKGAGYPVALSEAHEQAVVKSFDREFFFAALNKISSQSNHMIKFSQKSMKKRVVAV